MVRPSPTMKSAPIMITVELANPANASSTVITPNRNNATADDMATMSGFMRPHMKNTMVMARIRNVVAIGDMVGG